MKRIFFWTIVVVGFYTISLRLGLIAKFDLIDIPFHILGGMWLTAVWLWLARCFRLSHAQTYSVLFTGLFVFFGGLAWEIFEYVVATWFPFLIPGFEFYIISVRDIIGDLIMDILGGLFLLWWYRRHDQLKK